MKIEIKKLGTGEVLFSHDVADNTFKLTVEAAVNAGANLSYADMRGKDLTGAYMRGARMKCADLRYARMCGANIVNANMAGANMDKTYLNGVSYGLNTNFEGVTIRADCKLVGERPIFQIGPIGSYCDYLVVYNTDKGLRFDAGDLGQVTREAFEARLSLPHRHRDSMYTEEYKAALAFIDARIKILGTQKLEMNEEILILREEMRELEEANNGKEETIQGLIQQIHELKQKYE